jgi:hypothetical protein
VRGPTHFTPTGTEPAAPSDSAPNLEYLAAPPGLSARESWAYGQSGGAILSRMAARSLQWGGFGLTFGVPEAIGGPAAAPIPVTLQRAPSGQTLRLPVCSASSSQAPARTRREHRVQRAPRSPRLRGDLRPVSSIGVRLVDLARRDGALLRRCNQLLAEPVHPRRDPIR